MKLFLSYSSNDEMNADEIDNKLNEKGINVFRDIRELTYKSDIKEFMKQIGNTDFVVLLISDSFLKSHNCMFEILELINTEDYQKRTLQIILSSANIFTPEGRLGYVNYWKQKIETLQDLLLKNLHISNLKSVKSDLYHYKNIYDNIYDFMQKISDEKGVLFEDLKRNRYNEILDYIKSFYSSHEVELGTTTLLSLDDFEIGEKFTGIIKRDPMIYGLLIQVFKGNGFRDGLLHKSKFPTELIYKSARKFFKRGSEIEVEISDIIFDSPAAINGNTGGLGFILSKEYTKEIENRLTESFDSPYSKDLKILNLNDLGEIVLPKNISNCKNVEEIFLEGTKFISLPVSIREMNNLKHIYIEKTVKVPVVLNKCDFEILRV